MEVQRYTDYNSMKKRLAIGIVHPGKTEQSLIISDMEVERYSSMIIIMLELLNLTLKSKT